MMEIIQSLQREYMRDDLPPFSPGDTVRVHYRVVEGNNVRIQPFEGVVIGKRGGGTDATFTVRRIAAHGIGVERTFPLHSPFIKKIDVVRHGRVRPARLYYLRERSGKAARIKERRRPEGSFLR